MSDTKVCCKCKVARDLNDFGKLKSSKDGLRYDCKVCRRDYRQKNQDRIKLKQHAYYLANKQILQEAHRERWSKNKDRYNSQRKEYRQREDIKLHIQEKNKQYLPIKKQQIKERRKYDKNFQVSEILRSKIHKVISGKTTSYQSYIGCDVEFLKLWLEYRFDEQMTWDNLGVYWQIDHILPINLFDFTNDRDKYICFHWTNLQPLPTYENRSKSDKLMLHYYFNNIVSIVRFNDKYKKFLGYQSIRESLCWLRATISGMVKIPRMNNGQSAAKLLSPL